MLITFFCSVLFFQKIGVTCDNIANFMPRKQKKKKKVLLFIKKGLGCFATEKTGRFQGGNSPIPRLYGPVRLLQNRNCNLFLSNFFGFRFVLQEQSIFSIENYTNSWMNKLEPVDRSRAVFLIRNEKNYFGDLFKFSVRVNFTHFKSFFKFRLTAA